MPRGKTMTSTGRRKIEIKPIEDLQARHVCFSKRRNGAFSKASELATLCGAELAILLFSPAEHSVPYTFGHPEVQSVIDRFLSVDDEDKSGTDSVKEAAEESPTFRALRDVIEDFTKKIKKEEEKKVAMEKKFKELASRTPENKLLATEDNLTLLELEQLREAVSKVKLNADKHIAKLMDKGEPSSSNAPLAATPIRSWNPLEVGTIQSPPDCKLIIPKVEL